MTINNLYDQSQDTIDQYEEKAYNILLNSGTIKLVDEPLEDTEYVERVYELAQELWEINLYIVAND